MKQPSNNKNINMLAMDPEMALRQMIALTRNLVDFAEQETGALVRGDIIKLTAVQDDKEKLAHKYTKASAEFRKRIEQFRKADRALLDELENWQRELARKSEENNILVSQAQRRFTGGTQVTLLTAQELGQGDMQARQQEGA